MNGLNCQSQSEDPVREVKVIIVGVNGLTLLMLRHYLHPKHKNAKIVDKYSNPVVLVFMDRPH